MHSHFEPRPFLQQIKRVDYVFVDHISFHRPGTPYSAPDGIPFADNLFRFALLSLAALEAPLLLRVGGFRWALLQCKHARAIGG